MVSHTGTWETLVLVQLDVHVRVDVDEGADVGVGDDDVIVVVEENFLGMTAGAPIAVSSEPSAAGEHNDQCTGRNPAGQQRSRLVSSTLEVKGIPIRSPR